MSEPPRQSPVILDLEETPLPDAPSPAEAPPVEDGTSPAAEQALHRAARGGAWGLGTLIRAAAGGVAALALGLAAAGFVEALFARAALLGWAGLALVGVLAGALVAGAIGEAAALARLRRIDALRSRATAARQSGDRARAEAVVEHLAALYAGREELSPACERATRVAAEEADAEAVLTTAERALMPELDAAAERAVTRAARSVAAATALVPMPALDVLAILYANAGMIRRIARLYGGRAGWLGSWRLLRAVAVHLVATGAISATDDLLGPMVGGGVLGRLSRRFGEAAVNAALTARVGAAAIEICRPLPFAARPAPRASGLVFAALRDWQGKSARQRDG